MARSQLALIGLALGLVAWGCGGEAEETSPDAGLDLAATETPGEGMKPEIDSGSDAVSATAALWLEAGAFAVGQEEGEYVDTTRATPANGSFEELPSRSLTTSIWYPSEGSGTVEEPETDAALASGAGPRPLILYAHGFSSNRNENGTLAALLASRGFVVLAMDFPLTKLTAKGSANAADVLNQPGDLRFLLDMILARSADPGDPLRGAIDPERIGLIGVSLGAMSSVMMAFHESELDERIKVIATVAAPGCYLPPDFFAGRSIPIAIVHGGSDAVVPYMEHGPPMFEAAQAPKLFVGIEGGTHTAIAGIGTDMIASFDHPEIVGCHAMSINASVTPEALATLASQSGGEAEAVIRERRPDPCYMAPDFFPAIDVYRQIELIKLTFVPFFELILGSDSAVQAAATAFLFEQLGEAPEVTFLSDW